MKRRDPLLDWTTAVVVVVVLLFLGGFIAWLSVGVNA